MKIHFHIAYVALFCLLQAATNHWIIPSGGGGKPPAPQDALCQGRWVTRRRLWQNEGTSELLTLRNEEKEKTPSG